MRNVLRALAVTGALVTASCAGTIGVQPAGPNVWVVSEMRAPVLGGGRAAQDAALREANGFCAQQGRVFVPMDMQPGGFVYSPYGPTSFTTHFQCLAQDDPAVARMRQAPRAPG
jgi:hypothetical protein